MMRDWADDIINSLFASSYGIFVRYAFRRLGSLAVAEELVQDALLDLYRELRWGKPVNHTKAWTLRVLQRKVYKEMQRSSREGLRETIEDLDAELIKQEGSRQSEPALDEVTRLLCVLTPREQEVILLRMESLKYREIAGVLKISRNSVNTLLSRALRKLQVAARKGLEGESLRNHVERDTSKTLQ